MGYKCSLDELLSFAAFRLLVGKYAILDAANESLLMTGTYRHLQAVLVSLDKAKLFKTPA